MRGARIEVSNLIFVDDTDFIASSDDEIQDIRVKVNSSANRYGMDINARKSKVMEHEKRRSNTSVSYHG